MTVKEGDTNKRSQVKKEEDEEKGKSEKRKENKTNEEENRRNVKNLYTKHGMENNWFSCFQRDFPLHFPTYFYVECSVVGGGNRGE